MKGHPFVILMRKFKRNKGALLGLIVVLFFVFLAFFGPLLAPHNPSEIFPDSYRLPPSWQEAGNSQFLLGTDDVGRDLLSRLIHGARISMGVGFMVVLLSLSFGGALGLMAGYFGGWIDTVIMRAVDMLMALPAILLAIVIVAILGPSLFNAILAVSIVACPGFIRLVRACVMAEMPKEYVCAARSFGSGHFRLVFLNILPNCIAPIIIQASLGFSEGILNAAALGFLGLGAQPPTAEWGTMLSDARSFIESSPWMVTLPGICILLVVLSFNLLGDGLRDAFDPKVG